ncbi:MAG: tetratricopeptide repeat protein [Steroidobacteraceae bacterium]|nr:tetratricopeptide repeat protein [Steroidobacteraceae bacterium]
MSLRKISPRLVTAFAMAALVLAGSIASAPVYAQKAKGPTISKAVAKEMKAAQDALNAKQWDTALAKLSEASSKSGKTPFDQHMINEFQGFAYVRKGNYAEAARELEAGLNSGFLASGEVGTRVKALSQLNYQTKNYSKAVEYGQRAISNGWADEDIYTLVAQAKYVTNDYKGTYKFVNDWVTAQQKRGQTPKEQSLQLMLSSCIKLDDSDCTSNSLEKLVTYYPKTEYWQNLVTTMMRDRGNSERQTLNVFRLAQEVDAIRSGDDYVEMAQLAIEQGLPGEAQSVLETAMSKKLFTEQREIDRAQRLLDSAKKQANDDRGTLASQAKTASANKAGDADVRLGYAYMSYGMNAEAIAAIERGLAKGDVKNLDEAKLMLGVANLKAGNKDAAKKAFAEVKADPKLSRLASLWRLHAASI